jgi:hypothetical protein
MDGAAQGHITPAELDQAMRTADSRVRLILPRILRRVIKVDQGLTGFAFRIHHRKSYIIERQSLLKIVTPEEIGVNPGEILPDNLILLAQPDPQKLLETPAGDALIQCWRLLFHALVHLAVDERIADKSLNRSALSERIRRIGRVQFGEIGAVLGQEGFLLQPGSDLSIYKEFAAVFLELRYFAWHALPRYFPSLDDLDAVAGILQRDVDAQWLFLTSRPFGAPDPADNSADDLEPDIESAADMPSPSPKSNELQSPVKFRRLMRKSRRPESLGNTVRAAIYHVKALRCAPQDKVDRTRTVVNEDVNRLIKRLQDAMELTADSPQPWQDSLRALVRLSADGFWTLEARLLYDLQKVCIAQEREISKVDIFAWLFSFGRKPIKRPLPNQRDILSAQHLHSAERRLASARISASQRKQLSSLIRAAIEKVELRLREQFRPKMAAALESVGLKPCNLPEIVARNKIVEELLDRIVECGFLSLSDLRDALSRNALKLPDIDGPRTLFYGDPLLQADRLLAEELDGVYRPAEFYLRWMQQLSSLAFGTRIGRFLTLHIAVPLGGSYLINKGVDHLFALFLDNVHHYENNFTILLLGIFFYGLINMGWFRRFVGQSLKDFYHSVRDNIFIPLWHVIHSRIVQIILDSRIFRILFRYLMKPAIWTAVAWAIFPLVGVHWRDSLSSAAPLFLAINIFLNSRIGRNIEEMAADWFVQTWNRYGIRFFLGLFWIVVDFFQRVLEAIERLLYSVDQWLRFRSGETALTLCFKLGLGAIWSMVAYILRFCVSLLIEPQINPIKHFPVVTVSHKLLLPLIPHLAWILESRMGVEKGWALTLASTVIVCIPGIFGFLVWELKENWRLYAANRNKALSKAVIGSHGETMIRLLKPGFHSGTLPKIFTRLRRADRKSRKTGNMRPVRKYLRALEHLEVRIRRYFEREFLSLLAESKFHDTAHITIREIRLATNRVLVVFSCERWPNYDLSVEINVQSGWLLGDVSNPGWAGRLPAFDQQAIVSAILGLYKTAGLDMVDRQIESAFFPPVADYEIGRRGIIVYPTATMRHAEQSSHPNRLSHSERSEESGDQSSRTAIFYDLIENQIITPRAVSGSMPSEMPAIDRSQLMLRDLPITWYQWVQWWEDYQNNPDVILQPLATFAVVPKSRTI